MVEENSVTFWPLAVCMEYCTYKLFIKEEKMKAIKLLITLCVLGTIFLVGGIALAYDSGIFDSVSSDSTLAAPNLSVTIDGNQVTLSWNKATGATGYKVHYTQHPYDNPDTIKTIDVGDKTSASFSLSPGCAYHVAVKACKDSGSDCSDYSNIHDVEIPLVSTFKNSLGQEFKLIPAGTFIMGSPYNELGREDDETQHQVTLTQPFYMQTTEVTQAQFEAVMHSLPSQIITLNPTYPVAWVAYCIAHNFALIMTSRYEGTYSLPTEAQWEYAARAGSTTAFYNGHITTALGKDPNLDAIGWYIQNTKCVINHAVAQKTPNSWGLYDMLGNLQEWCQDFYAPYPSGSVVDPVGPKTGRYNIVRGGNVCYSPQGCRSAYRGIVCCPGDPCAVGPRVGFRLVYHK